MLTYFRQSVDTDGVSTVTMDYPGLRINKLSLGVWAELSELVTEWTTNTAIKAVVIASAKEGIFLAGADIGELTDIRHHEQAVAMSERAQVIFDRLEACGKPVVAAVNGVTLGGGFELALACHAIVAADDRRVKLGLPETKLGLLPAAGGTQRLPRLIGVSRAVELVVSGDSFSAQEGLQLKIVAKVVPLNDLLPEAKALALSMSRAGKTTKTWNPVGEVASAPSDFPHDLRRLARSKAARAVVEGSQMSFADGLRCERELFADLAISDAAKELIQRFLTKTKA